MNKTRKIEYLYKYAHGQGMLGSNEEKAELRKYKVSPNDGDYATKANISAYVNAVDNGYRLSFYDWCMNNHKADRRRRGSSEREMASKNTEMGAGAMMFGWLFWGVAIYWMFHGSLTVGTCAIVGAIVSVVLLRLNRRMAGFTLLLLPVILMVIFGS